MKKTALTILLTAAASVMAHAQTAYDAWLFSENNYEGTARSVAMGNAFTALGGDLGAVTINPAGSAVAGYSQLTLTPSLTFSANTAVGVPYDGSRDPYFQRKMKSSMTRAGVPNIGFTFHFKTGRTSGLKSITAGFIANRTNSWCEDIYANGTNNSTSFLAAAAADASGLGITPENFMNENAYDNYAWADVVGYRSGMFSNISSHPDAYIGATEILISDDPLNVNQEGAVDQTYGRSVSGNKYEYIVNVGANISDFVYIGFNLGFNSINYEYTHYFKERAIDPAEFENRFTDQEGNEQITFFDRATYRYSYSATGSGVFGKLGIIVTPGSGLRFGAAVQTPTATTMTEKWQESASTEFTDNGFNGSATSPLGKYTYEFSSPWRANFGAAYTLGSVAVFSADYEVAAFSGMKYETDRHDMSTADLEHFEDINQDIRQNYKSAHYLRLGAEFKPVSTLAVRAGYNLASSATGSRILGHNIAIGAGYNSKNSFFADIACRYTLPEHEYILPYSDYREAQGILSPEIRSTHSNWKLLLTLGWRF